MDYVSHAGFADAALSSSHHHDGLVIGRLCAALEGGDGVEHARGDFVRRGGALRQEHLTQTLVAEFDFIELPGGDLGLAIGDVSGKGVSAALIMSSVQAALRVAAPIEDDLARLVARLNALIFRSARGRKYATFFFARYTPSTGVLRYVNAGHNPPYIIAGTVLTEIGSTGRPIGLLPESSYSEGTIELPPGSTLFLYTDGLNEAADPEEVEFGNERLRELFLSQSGAATNEIPARVLDAVTAFERGAKATDDKTIVVMRRT